jgi:hypothetical protein
MQIAKLILDDVFRHRRRQIRVLQVHPERGPKEIAGGIDRLQAVARRAVATLEQANPVVAKIHRALDVEFAAGKVRRFAQLGIHRRTVIHTRLRLRTITPTHHDDALALRLRS